MKTRTLAATAALFASASILLVSCGGGGGGSSTVPTASAPVTQPNLNQTGTTTTTGAKGKITVSIKLPQKQEPTEALHAKLRKLFGARLSDKHIRTIANTAATAKLRTLGAQQNRWAAQVEKQTGRNPEFIAGNTDSLELVLSDGNGVEYDTMGSCNTSTCTIAVSDVPVGSYQASLYLYETCGFLLGAGTTTSNVTISTTTPATATITVNPVVGYFDVESSNVNSPLLANFPQSLNMTVTPLDFSMSTVTGQPGAPGVLLDSDFNQITSVSLGVNGASGAGMTLSTSSLAVAADNTLPGFTASWTGVYEGESQVDIIAQPSTGAQIVPEYFDWYDNLNVNQSGYTNSGDLPLDVSYNETYWNDNINYYTGLGAPNPKLSLPFNIGVGNEDYNLEFPNAVNTGAYSFQVSSSNSAVTTIDVTSTGCGGILSPLPDGPYANDAAVTLHMATSAASQNVCVITASDNLSAPTVGTLHIYVDSTTLTIQSKARKH